MKSILQSIKPQYCELIASGKKTIEVRKTRPKLDVPFKVYIYCTKKSYLGLLEDDFWLILKKKVCNGKVIGEYVCDEIIEYETELHPSDDLFQGIWETFYDEDINDTLNFIVTSNDEDNPDDCDLCKKSCLSFDDIRNYVGYGDRKFYAWHISDLKIYDKPKELSEFQRACNHENCGKCKRPIIEKLSCTAGLTHPPLSWCYVEEG